MTNEAPQDFNLNAEEIDEIIRSYELDAKTNMTSSTKSFKKKSSFQTTLPSEKIVRFPVKSFLIEDEETKEFFTNNKSQDVKFTKYEENQHSENYTQIYETPKSKTRRGLKDKDLSKKNRKSKNSDIKKYLEKKRNIHKNENSFKKEEKEIKKKLKKVIDNKEFLLPTSTTCSICLEEIVDLANPNNCNHDFCKNCLFKWSQNCSTTCPLCKKPFHKIFIYDKNKKIEIKVLKKKQKNIIELEPRRDCYVCGSYGHRKDLIQCAKCNYNVCHYYCDKLDRFPNGRWICISCKEEIKEQKQIRRSIGRQYVN